MHTVADLARTMNDIAPLRYAEEWDNVGLLIGSGTRVLDGPVLLTIDMTEPVVEEARQARCSAVIAYHPPIFNPLKRITDASGRERIVHGAIAAGLAVYSPHTAIDAVKGGVTDWLADGVLSGGADADRRPIAPFVDLPESQQVKVVTFVPRSHAELVRDALASAGAGRIGEYDLCSFEAEGHGTFRGSEQSNPAVGKPGETERVGEVRLEMVCSRKALPLAMTTLHKFHPYEHPAVDVYALLGRHRRSIGAGRRLMLDHPLPLDAIAERLKLHLDARTVKIARATDKVISVVGVVPGAGGSLADAARADGCELFITGEMRHHEVIAQVEQGMSVMLAGHTTTERGYLPTLAARLSKAMPDSKFVVSSQDRTPFEYV